MESINFDRGYKTYAINGDENNVIRVNLADQNLMTRAAEVMTALDEFKEELKSGAVTDAAEIYDRADKLLKEKFDYAFGKGTAAAVFGDLHFMTVANDDGECIFETFMKAFLPVAERDIAEAAGRQKKHIADLVDAGKLDAVADSIKGAAT